MDSTRPITFATLAIQAALPAQIPPTVSPANQDTIGAYQTEDSARPAPVDVLLATLQEHALAAWQTTTSSNQTAFPVQPTATNALMVQHALHAQQVS